jgi:polyphosphate:AMP phosphotransferase
MKNASKPSKALLKQIEEQGQELAYLQRKCKEHGIPILIIVEGLSAAGKGTLINRIIQPLDPRGFKVSCIASPSRDEQLRPFLWRFWRRTPSTGRIAIFDRSWYRNLLDADIDQRLSEAGLARAYEDVRAFERQLRDGGTIILKFFLEITRQEQAARLAALQANPATSWRVDDAVLKRLGRYKEYDHAVTRMYRESDADAPIPWVKLKAKNNFQATASAQKVMIEVLSKRVKLAKSRGISIPKPSRSSVMPRFAHAPKLSEVDLSQSLSKKEYVRIIEEKQARIHDLHNEMYRRRIPMVIVYEGWDAAGKGGNIRRLTARMDPRGYEVIPVSAPNDIEKSHHYLWRFWSEFPKAGHVAIYDRSWYGRVLVERVEGFCKEWEWKQAYREINEMEENFVNAGTILVKFWLHIDPKEQLQRFKAREINPSKQWKLGDEDWRNREKWVPYEKATNDMFLRTHTHHGSWTIIEANCKRFARIRALDTVIEAIEKRFSE